MKNSGERKSQHRKWNNSKEVASKWGIQFMKFNCNPFVHRLRFGDLPKNAIEDNIRKNWFLSNNNTDLFLLCTLICREPQNQRKKNVGFNGTTLRSPLFRSLFHFFFFYFSLSLSHFAIILQENLYGLSLWTETPWFGRRWTGKFERDNWSKNAPF